MNIYKNDVSELNESFYASVQTTILPALLDLVGENGFQIENATSCRLSSLQAKSKAAFADNGEIYLKYFNGEVQELLATCDRILKNKKWKSHEKALVNRLKERLLSKEKTDRHTIWYIGQTLRGLDIREKEMYPRVMHEFGEVVMIPVASIPEKYKYTYYALLMESVIGGLIQSATNNTLAAADDEHEDISFKDMGGVNMAHTGPVNWESIWNWAKSNHKQCKDLVVEDLEIAVPPAVLNWIDHERGFIAECVNKKNNNNNLDEFHKPTLDEVCIAGGCKCQKLGRGIHNKNHPDLVNAGVDNWGAYHMLEKNDEGKSVHAVKLGEARHTEKNDEGKSVHAVNMAEAQRLKKLEDGATEMELFCYQCSNPR